MADFARVIVQGGNQEIGDLKPDIGFLLEPREHIKHGLQMCERDTAVEAFREGLEVHIRGVHMVIDIVEGLARYIAVGDHHRADPRFTGGVADIDNVFAPDRRLVISERDRRAAVADRQRDDVFRRNVRRVNLVRFRFRDVPVLAEKAAHVASCRAK